MAARRLSPLLAQQQGYHRLQPDDSSESTRFSAYITPPTLTQSLWAGVGSHTTLLIVCSPMNYCRRRQQPTRIDVLSSPLSLIHGPRRTQSALSESWM